MRFWLAIIILLLANTYSLAQEQTESGFPSGSAIDVGFMYNKILAKSTDKLNMEYKKLLTTINEYNKENNRLENDVREQHEAWLKYYPSECNISGTLSNTGGSWPSTYSVQCYVRVVDEQTKKISSIINCMKNVSDNDKITDDEKDDGIFTVKDKRNSCLYKLGSMVLHYD